MAGAAWCRRRVVPAPRPRRVLGTAAVRTLSATGRTVIAGGGGGIPLVESADGGLRGVGAVVDKDLTSALLAEGQFPEGGMGPKIRAALDFVAGAPHRRVLITSPSGPPTAHEGHGGTWPEHGPAPHPPYPQGPLTAGRPQ
ncbi:MULTISPECIES: hypothetical protein [unclassified Streptomyces]|uniref:hypothetical protein n=1 Tax=unclassified Streptomyces TaxID=2593676 RepID=UPI00037D94C6|nr:MULTISPECIES: hypothetical protein [unclassified Streptomyces]